MSASATALTGFAAWTLLMVISIGLLRASLVLSGRRASNQFDPGGADVSPFSQRLCRVHANCYENLPVFGALIAVALVTGRHGLTDPLAMWVLYARIGQSVVHLISTSVMMPKSHIRATGFWMSERVMTPVTIEANSVRPNRPVISKPSGSPRCRSA